MEINFTLTHATFTKSDYEKIVGFCRTHGLTDLPNFPEPKPEVMVSKKGVKFDPKDPDEKLLS